MVLIYCMIRNTSKEKKKRNKGFPYKKGGKYRNKNINSNG